MVYSRTGKSSVKDLKLGSVSEVGTDPSPTMDEKSRLAELISAEFSDHVDQSELEAQVHAERQLRVTYSKRFEEVSHRIRDLESEIADKTGDIGRLERELETLRSRLQTAQSTPPESLERLEEERKQKEDLEFKLQQSQAAITAAHRREKEKEETLSQLRAELAAVREQAYEVQVQRDLLEQEDPEARLERMRRQSEDASEEAQSLRTQVSELQGELEMRMAVLEGLRQDYAGSEDLRGRNEILAQENAQIRDELTSALARLDMVEDLEGLERIIHQTQERAEAAEKESGELRRDLGSVREKLAQAEEDLVIGQQELTATYEGAASQLKPWKVLSGVLGFVVMVLSLRPTAASVVKGPPGTSPVDRKIDRPEVDEILLQKAALSALDRKADGLAVAPPPEEALRGDLNEYQVLLARVARGDEVEPILEHFIETTEATSARTSRSLHILARVLRQQERFKLAESLTDRALALSREVGDLHALKGQLRLQAEDLKGAEASFQEALRIDPTIARAHGGMAFIYEMRGDDELARQSLEKALALLPDAPRYQYSLAMILRLQGNFIEASRLLRKFLESRPTDAYAHWYLAESLSQRGQHEEAARLRAEARRLGYVDESSSAAPASPEASSEPR